MNTPCPHSIISVVCCILNGVVKRQDIMNPYSPISRFTALHNPNISIVDYMERIHKYTHCTTESLVLSLVYIDRLIQSNTVAVNSLSIHRIIVTSIMLAAKFFDDSFYQNSLYARIGGVSTEELNLLEIDFLQDINFTLHVSSDDYQKYHNELVNHIICGCCHSCCDLCLPYLLQEDREILSLCYESKFVTPDSPVNFLYAGDRVEERDTWE